MQIFNCSIKLTSIFQDIINIQKLLKLLIRYKVFYKNKQTSISYKAVHSLTFRWFAPNGGVGGGSAILSCQKILMGNELNYSAQKIDLNYSFKEDNLFFINHKNSLWDLWGGIKFAFIKTKKEQHAVYITHDYATAFGLYLLNKKYTLVHHLQGSRVEEKINFGEKFSFITKKIIQFCEKKAFQNAEYVSFPSKGANKVFLNSKHTKVKKHDFKLGPILYNTVYGDLTPRPFDNIKKNDKCTAFLSISSLTTAKGVDRNINFFEALLSKSKKNIRYFIVGNGPLYQTIINKLELLKKRYNHFSYISIKSCSYPEAIFLQSIADVYISLHRISIFDIATLEAMLHSNIIILSHTGGNIDFNKDDNIIMLHQEDYEGLVQSYLSANTRLLQYKNYQVFSKYFSQDNFIQSYTKLIYMLLNLDVELSETQQNFDDGIYSQWRIDGKSDCFKEKIKEKSKLKYLSPEEPHIEYLIYISYLIENTEYNEAKKALQIYMNTHELKDIDRFLLISNFAYKNNIINDAVIKKAHKVFNELELNNKNNTLYKVLKGKSIAIVGNSPSALGLNKGKEIDAHDIVIRFNNYQTSGFEKDYGEKTDIWARGSGGDDVIKRRDNKYKLVIWEADYNHFFVHFDHLDVMYNQIKNNILIYN